MVAEIRTKALQRDTHQKLCGFMGLGGICAGDNTMGRIYLGGIDEESGWLGSDTGARAGVEGPLGWDGWVRRTLGKGWRGGWGIISVSFVLSVVTCAL